MVLEVLMGLVLKLAKEKNLARTSGCVVNAHM